MKLFKQDEYRSRGRFLGWGSGPNADWRVMFLIFLILIILSVAYSVSVFFRVNRGDFGSSLNGATEDLIDKKLLQQNVSFYKDRKAQFDILLTTKETTPDPSK